MVPTVRLRQRLKMLLWYVIESCATSCNGVEVYGEEYARETSASFSCKPSAIDARVGPCPDRGPA